MALPRTLEPEVMDTPEEAATYDSMDHAAANRAFLADLLSTQPDVTEVLDLGAGTARIPIELCRIAAESRVVATDLSVSMLDVARINIELAGLMERIRLGRVDAKCLPYAGDEFTVVMSNSIVHHIADPRPVFAEAMRVARPRGRLFFRDLLRPDREVRVQELVRMYAGRESAHAQQLLGDSLRAALRLTEVQAIVDELGFPPDTVQVTSDRHWTWTAEKPPRGAE